MSKKEHDITKWLNFYINKGFHIFALSPARKGEKGTGKQPSTRSTLFTKFDSKGNPLPLKNSDGTIKLNKYGQTDYGKGNGGGVLGATRDLSRLTKMFTDPLYTDRSISGLGIGLACGQLSNILAVDVDNPKYLEVLEIKYGKLPATRRQNSGGGSGHYHLVFRPTRSVGGGILKTKSVNNFIAPKIDVKGDGGYIALQPTMHHSGGFYKWDQDSHKDFAELPRAWYDLIWGLPWFEREDGLFEQEKKEYWEEHKKRTRSTGELPEDFKLLPNDMFYCRIKTNDGYKWFGVKGVAEGGRIYCNCPHHKSESERSFHIDWKGDHWEWYCFGCPNLSGGWAATKAEYEEYILYRKGIDGIDKLVAQSSIVGDTVSVGVPQSITDAYNQLIYAPIDLNPIYAELPQDVRDMIQVVYSLFSQYGSHFSFFYVLSLLMGLAGKTMVGNNGIYSYYANNFTLLLMNSGRGKSGIGSLKTIVDEFHDSLSYDDIPFEYSSSDFTVAAAYSTFGKRKDIKEWIKLSPEQRREFKKQAKSELEESHSYYCYYDEITQKLLQIVNGGAGGSDRKDFILQLWDSTSELGSDTDEKGCRLLWDTCLSIFGITQSDTWKNTFCNFESIKSGLSTRFLVVGDDTHTLSIAKLDLSTHQLCDRFRQLYCAIYHVFNPLVQSRKSIMVEYRDGRGEDSIQEIIDDIINTDGYADLIDNKVIMGDEVIGKTYAHTIKMTLPLFLLAQGYDYTSAAIRKDTTDLLTHGHREGIDGNDLHKPSWVRAFATIVFRTLVKSTNYKGETTLDKISKEIHKVIYIAGNDGLDFNSIVTKLEDPNRKGVVHEKIVERALLQTIANGLIVKEGVSYKPTGKVIEEGRAISTDEKLEIIYKSIQCELNKGYKCRNLQMNHRIFRDPATMELFCTKYDLEITKQGKAKLIKYKNAVPPAPVAPLPVVEPTPVVIPSKPKSVVIVQDPFGKTEEMEW